MIAIITMILDNWQAVVGGVGVLAVFLFGRKSANNKHEARKAKEDAKTQQRINEIEPVDPDDRSDIERRLREHGE
jgi:MFS superfamily sulfate permease-like transporter